MKDSEYKSLLKFDIVGGGLMAANDAAIDLVNNNKGQIELKPVSARDISMHRCYFSLLNYIWQWMPSKFKSKVSQKSFYQWLKHLQGSYNILYEFKDGSKFIEYHSISFAKMNQIKFKEYVRNQLPVIYQDLIHPLYDDKQANMIIENIEEQFEQYLNNL